MEYIFEFWWMLPVAFCVCLTATSTSVEGAVFFAPIFILLFPWAAGVTIVPLEAVFLALSIEIFGFGSALTGYMRRRLVDYSIAKKVLVVSIPVGMAFGFLAHSVARRAHSGPPGRDDGASLGPPCCSPSSRAESGRRRQAGGRRRTHARGRGRAGSTGTATSTGPSAMAGRPLGGVSRGVYGHRHRRAHDHRPDREGTNFPSAWRWGTGNPHRIRDGAARHPGARLRVLIRRSERALEHPVHDDPRGRLRGSGIALHQQPRRRRGR